MTSGIPFFRSGILGPRVCAILGAKPLYLGMRLILGGLFIWAGIVKFLDLDSFANIILAYDLVPEALVDPVVLIMPTLEIAAGVGAILGFRSSYWGLLALLGIFLAVLWFGILKDLDIDCGCFSLSETGGQVTLAEAFARDLLFVLGVMYLLAWPRLREGGQRALKIANPIQGG